MQRRCRGRTAKVAGARLSGRRIGWICVPRSLPGHDARADFAEHRPAERGARQHAGMSEDTQLLGDNGQQQSQNAAVRPVVGRARAPLQQVPAKRPAAGRCAHAVVSAHGDKPTSTVSWTITHLGCSGLATRVFKASAAARRHTSQPARARARVLIDSKRIRVSFKSNGTAGIPVTDVAGTGHGGESCAGTTAEFSERARMRISRKSVSGSECGSP